VPRQPRISESDSQRPEGQYCGKSESLAGRGLHSRMRPDVPRSVGSVVCEPSPARWRSPAPPTHQSARARAARTSETSNASVGGSRMAGGQASRGKPPPAGFRLPWMRVKWPQAHGRPENDSAVSGRVRAQGNGGPMIHQRSFPGYHTFGRLCCLLARADTVVFWSFPFPDYSFCRSHVFLSNVCDKQSSILGWPRTWTSTTYPGA